ncbi:hypothetical protein Tco_0744736 [Tanacetum coccineum]
MNVRRIEEEVDPNFLSDAHSRTCSAESGDSCESKLSEIVRFPFYLLFADIVDTGWYYRCNSRMRELVMKYKAEKVYHEEMVKMPFVDLKVLEIDQCTSDFHGHNESGAQVAFEDEFGTAEEREVSCEAQQGRSGVKRKLFGSCRNNMGNEPILALPEGSDNFVVMLGARVRMLA